MMEDVWAVQAIGYAFNDGGRGQRFLLLLIG